MPPTMREASYYFQLLFSVFSSLFEKVNLKKENRNTVYILEKKNLNVKYYSDKRHQNCEEIIKKMY